jgi:hypothetical protein
VRKRCAGAVDQDPVVFPARMTSSAVAHRIEDGRVGERHGRRRVDDDPVEPPSAALKERPRKSDWSSSRGFGVGAPAGSIVNRADLSSIRT